MRLLSFCWKCMDGGKRSCHLTVKFDLVTFTNIMYNSFVGNLLYIAISSCLHRDLHREYHVKSSELWWCCTCTAEYQNRLARTAPTDCPKPARLASRSLHVRRLRLPWPDWATISDIYRDKLSLSSINYRNYRDKNGIFAPVLKFIHLSLYEDSFSIFIYSALYNKSPRISVLFQSCSSSLTSIVSGLSCALSQVIVRRALENTRSGLSLIAGIDKISRAKRDRRSHLFYCISCVHYLISDIVTSYNGVSI
jgi:hypothetical protein